LSENNNSLAEQPYEKINTNIFPEEIGTEWDSDDFENFESEDSKKKLKSHNPVPKFLRTIGFAFYYFIKLLRIQS
jgi:hypothetical protein